MDYCKRNNLSPSNSWIWKNVEKKYDKIDYEINLYDNKYTYIFYKDGTSECLRYGEKWRDTTGDNLLFHMSMTIKDLQKQLKIYEELQ